MSIIKIAHRERNYLVIQKECLENKSLTWGAKGLDAYLMGKPADWQVRVSELIRNSPHGKDATYSYLKELTEHGYISKTYNSGKRGQFGGITYAVYETKQAMFETESPLPKNQKVVNSPLPGFPDPDNPLPVNPPLLNINITKERNTKEGAERPAAAFFQNEEIDACYEVSQYFSGEQENVKTKLKAINDEIEDVPQLGY
jgi:hypothetical protein